VLLFHQKFAVSSVYRTKIQLLSVNRTPRCGLTPRSSGAPTACRQAQAGGTLYIFANPGPSSHRRAPLSSNVRPHEASRDLPPQYRHYEQVSSYGPGCPTNRYGRRGATLQRLLPRRRKVLDGRGLRFDSPPLLHTAEANKSALQNPQNPHES
jgi:hypothetical protein